MEENDSKENNERCVFSVLVFSFLLLLQMIKKSIVALELHCCNYCCCKWEETWCCNYEDVKDDDECNNTLS